MIKRSYREGFTLIEISLSLIFVAILALAIALIISNTINSYQRGLTLNQVNTVGMSLTDNFRTVLQNSSAKTLTATCAIVYKDTTERAKCEEDEAFLFTSMTKYAPVIIKDGAGNEKREENVPIFGALCTGTYSYLWNSGYFWSQDADFSNKTNKSWAKLQYKGEDGALSVIGNDAPFKLLKVADPSRAVCIAAVNPSYDSSSNETGSLKYAEPDGGMSNMFDISRIGDGKLSMEPEYLIAENSSSQLALYELAVMRPALSKEDNSLFFAGSFILGTVGGGINIMSQGKTCAAPNDYKVENFDYCAINKFNFAVQASGE